LKEDPMTAKHESAEKLESLLEQMSDGLDAIETGAAEAGEEIRHTLTDHIEALRAEILKGHEILREMEKSCGRDRPGPGGDRGNIWGVFKKSFKKAGSEFKRGYREGMDD